MKKIEYLNKTLPYITDFTLQSLGREGWELCASHRGTDGDNIYYFKREIKEVDDIPESKLKSFVKTEMCRGCDDYNVECQIFTSTTLVKLRKVHKDNDPPWDSSPIVEVPNCYHQQDHIFISPDRTC